MDKEPQFQEVLVITLDGSSGSGKSTLSQRLAVALDWPFLDSGAWYRALTWAVLQAGVNPQQEEDVLATLFSLNLHADAHGVVSVNGEACTDCLRTPAVDQAVAQVANHIPVREALNQSMRAMRHTTSAQGLVADGRDAGTIIFPDAALKVFVEASLDVRAERRFAQRKAQGISTTLSAVRDSLAQRDAMDAARGDAAPHPTAQSRILVNENITVEEAVGCLLTWAQELLASR